MNPTKLLMALLFSTASLAAQVTGTLSVNGQIMEVSVRPLQPATLTISDYTVFSTSSISSGSLPLFPISRLVARREITRVESSDAGIVVYWQPGGEDAARYPEEKVRRFKDIYHVQDNRLLLIKTEEAHIVNEPATTRTVWSE